MGKRKHHSPEQTVRKLQDADRRLNAGQTIEQVCQALTICESTFHRWRNQYGGTKAQEARRLKKLEQENARLKKMVADLMLDKEMLKELAEGNFQARRVGVMPWRNWKNRSRFRNAGLAKCRDSTVRPNVM